MDRKLKMEALVSRIKRDGTVLGDDILKVDSFLTHQVDPMLMRQFGQTFAQKFADSGITKVVTIEASGNVPAAYVAEELDVPMIFAKKAKNVTMNDELLTAEVYSFTKRIKKFLKNSSNALKI